MIKNQMNRNKAMILKMKDKTVMLRFRNNLKLYKMNLRKQYLSKMKNRRLIANYNNRLIK